MPSLNLYQKSVLLLAFCLSILLIPLVAMQFSSEVDWSVFDFVVGGILLFFFGSVLTFIFHKTKNTKYKIYVVAAMVLFFLLIWAEIAVGIFGSPIAGS